VQILHKYNIQQNWLFIVGYPSETEIDFQETKNLLSRYANLAHNQLITIQVTPTFALLDNSPLLNNPELTLFYGLEHNRTLGSNKFWTSTKFIDNEYPIRSRRWKDLINHIENLGYTFGRGMPVTKWKQEIENLDKIYAEQHVKIFPLYTK